MFGEDYYIHILMFGETYYKSMSYNYYLIILMFGEMTSYNKSKNESKIDTKK